ncbi:hypothetical protein [Dechloromonas denitrificans]|uniref:phage tail fiber protein n=1 Tax=Dechloromonas denitrificans TaxID=281362 RepID=UPI001CF8C8BA|nr:hypothetical protein [Dechloromonas denitrificans]UCV02286.1 hypothetical protein KI611_14465 [Dechloromonas denitrificans]
MKNIRLTLISLVAAILCFSGGYAVAGALTDYGENHVIDSVIRGQALGAPATPYIGLDTATCSDSGIGTEPSGNAYARVAVSASLTAWSGTISNSSTALSTGTSGATYSLAPITYTASSGPWGTLQAVRWYDAATGGNSWICINLTTPLNVSGSGFTVSFPAGALSFTLD